MKVSRKQNLLTVALFGALACFSTPLVAQENTNAVPMEKMTEAPERPPYRPWTIGVGLGTDGIFGGGVLWRFSDHFGARTGVGYSESSWDAVGVAGIDYDLKVRLLFEPLTFDIYPWKKHSFRISLGVLFNQNEMTGTASSTGTVIIDGQPLPIRAGDLTMKLHQELVNPYLGIGGNFFYFDHAHHWALGGEIGVAYTGNASASLDRSGPTNPAIAAALQSAKNRLQDYADQFTWWPVVKIGVSYSF
jgi:hypothetical protein